MIYSKFKAACVRERCHMILEAAESQNVPTTLGDLAVPFKVSRAINPILERYIDDMISEDSKRDGGSLLEPTNLRAELKSVLDAFKPSAVRNLSQARPSIEDVKKSRKNLYQLAGARELAFANKATRTLSTSMGSIWEDLADISPYALNPEKHFGVKIRGIDVILRDISTGEIKYGQLKTQRNTLTGSQSGRANSELGLHQHSFLAACFDTKAGWTYKPNQQIKRLVGEEFWSMIGMDYALVVEEVGKMVRDLEDAYVTMLE